MTPERAKLVRQTFESAIERSLEDVEDFLGLTCGDDSELHSEVKRMLQEHLRTGLRNDAHGNATPGANNARSVFSEGQILGGRYRVVRYLGRGGMGEVYEAEDLHLPEMKEHVALKTLLPGIADDAEMITRFRREVALSRKVQHRNVCAAYDLASHEARGAAPVLFLSMPFLPGETLEEKLHRDGRLGQEEALPLLQQMALGLEAAHKVGVIHRDFKPSNVMLSPEREGVRVVVTDFGLARSFVAASATTTSLSKTLVGTLNYMAPELLTGSVATFGSDVYALGMVAYRMVTGTLPFANCTPMAGAIMRSKTCVPSPRAYVPALDSRWEQAIMRALDGNPARRFSHTRGFIEAIEGNRAVAAAAPLRLTWWRTVGTVAATVALLAGILGPKLRQTGKDTPPAQAEVLYRKGLEDIHAGAYFAASNALGQSSRVAPKYALAHARLAEAWVEQDLPEKASQEMLLVRRLDLSRLSPVDKLQVEAIDLRITREFKAAAAKYEQMLIVAGARASDLYVDLGRAYERAQDRSKALQYYQRAAQGPSDSPAAWLRLGVFYARSSEWEKSDEAFDRAEKLYQFSSVMEGLTEVAFQRGVAASRRLKFDLASAHLRKAMDTAHLAGNAYQEAQAKLQMAQIAYISGDGDTAEHYAREALDASQTNQFQALMVNGLIGLGNTHSLKNDLMGAEKLFQDGLTISRRNNMPRLVASCLFSLASLNDRLKRPDDAAREAEEALNYFQANRFVQETFSMLTVLGRVQRDRGDYRAAMASFHHLQDAAEQSKDLAQLAAAHEGMGGVFVAEEQYPQALEQYRDDLHYAPEGQSAGYARLWCGFLLAQLGRNAEATEMWNAADPYAAKFPTLRLALQEHRALRALIAGDGSGAAKLAQVALAGSIPLDPRSASAFHRITGAAKITMGKKVEGRRDCERALEILGTAADANVLLQTRLSVLQARVETLDSKAAMAVFQEMEPAFASHPESHWRALALISRIDQTQSDAARQVLAELQNQWGKEAYEGYIRRPDIRKLASQLLNRSSSNKR